MTTRNEGADRPRSRLDNGRFSAADVQTMARAVEVPVEKVRRLTELAVFVAGLEQAGITDEQAEQWLRDHDLYAVTHLHVGPPDCGECNPDHWRDERIEFRGSAILDVKAGHV